MILFWISLSKSIDNLINSNITKNILVADTNKVLDEYNNIYESGYDSKKFISSLMNYFRTIIYYKLGLDNTVDDIEVLSDDEIANIKIIYKIHVLSLFQNQGRRSKQLQI